MGTDLLQSTSPGNLTLAGTDPWSAWLGVYAKPTQDAYRRDLGQWQEFCDAHAVDYLHPLPGHVSQWIAALRQEGRSAATVARKISTLASFYRWARHNLLTTADPMPLPAERPKVHTDDAAKLGLGRDQLRRVLRESVHYGPRAHALVTLLTYCGLRVSEALSANLTDVTEQSGHRVLRVVGKGSRPRTVPLPAPVWHVLSEYIDGRDSGPLFTTSTGKRLDRFAAHGTIKAIGKRAGVELHPHLLRHSAATQALDAGAPLDRVQSLMGHASPTVTMRYGKARDQLNNSAAFDLARYLAE